MMSDDDVFQLIVQTANPAMANLVHAGLWLQLQREPTGDEFETQFRALTRPIRGNRPANTPMQESDVRLYLEAACRWFLEMPEPVEALAV